MVKRWLGQILIEASSFPGTKQIMWSIFFLVYSIQRCEYLLIIDLNKFWHLFPWICGMTWRCLNPTDFKNWNCVCNCIWNLSFLTAGLKKILQTPPPPPKYTANFHLPFTFQFLFFTVSLMISLLLFPTAQMKIMISIIASCKTCFVSPMH